MSQPVTSGPAAIEPMRREDWAAVRAIYAEGLATGIAAFSRSPPRWEDWDAAHVPTARLVVRVEGHVAGFAALTRVADT